MKVRIPRGSACIDPQLRQCVIDEWDDPTPKLILADWLEEHSEYFRAAAFRLYVELEKKPESHKGENGHTYWGWRLKRREIAPHYSDYTPPFFAHELPYGVFCYMPSVWNCRNDSSKYARKKHFHTPGHAVWECLISYMRILERPISLDSILEIEHVPGFSISAEKQPTRFFYYSRSLEEIRNG